MLSILIPTYHYNAFPLAKEIEKQALKNDITFEIICLDDASKSTTNIENQQINHLKNSSFLESEYNVGSIKTRYLLAQKAKYNWLLFLDADTCPKNSNFISNYMAKINTAHKVIFGGLEYKPIVDTEYSLRSVFGKKREALKATLRNKLPYKAIASANFLIDKSVFLQVFNFKIDNKYGQDYLFGAILKSKNIPVKHINNPVYHLGLETNSAFLKKTETAIKTLSESYKNQMLTKNDISLIQLYEKLKKIGVIGLIKWLFTILEKPIKNHLLGKSPSLFLFDFYRLGYFCKVIS